MNTDTDKATLITESILESKKTSVLTGAGISTESVQILEISPVNYLPSACKRFIVINKARTDFDNMAYAV